MNIRKWSGQNHNTVIIHEYISDFNLYFVQNAFLDTTGGHLYTSHNTQVRILGKSTEYKCPRDEESAVIPAENLFVGAGAFDGPFADIPQGRE